ncbi:hypothetical protein ACIRVK_06540 [Streptomyces sp. NPDC101152]|uniref:hypothetical protein n=1 Tax=Streptomyces sp. NPDC101152 TaxID=3366116 RepID=UPI003823B093
MTWKEQHLGEVEPAFACPEEPEEPAQVKGCSDLLEDFLNCITWMQSEYLKAAP